MKIYICIFSFFLLSTRYILAQNELKDSLLIIAGNIIDENQEPVPFAHIVSKKTFKGTIADTIGLFQFKINKNDTILVTALGYEDMQIAVLDLEKESLLHIELQSKLYELEGVVKYKLKRYEQFKHDFLNLKLPELHPQAYKGLPKSDYVKPELEMPKIGSPISLVYSFTSKEAEEVRKTIQFKENIEKNATIYSVLKKEKIEDITGFVGDKLEKFIIYCNFPKRLQSKDDEYTIINKILQCVTEFEDSTE